ncbi:hypothetical protein L195_g019259 [Trifolium pratense]|uniref:DUF4283 domain-containing protein n=1 Tax=Trifolium pratense TaxID=57577 RepID=A0A2K3MZ38_TRIPR|nr:hypothetical protein L195_g019259 [Trifolium pratense]
MSSTTENVLIPWSFLLDSSEKPSPKSSIPPTTKKSFADAVSNVCDVPSSQLPQPVIKGNDVAISIPEEDYQSEVDACKHCLHGRIIWPKGAKPVKVCDLKTKLLPLWKSLGRWGITSLGKGYYEFCFSSIEDVQNVRSVSSWNLNPGILKLFTWTKDFNPSFQQNSSAQVWVRIFGLSQEYWRPNILFAIANSLGTPICIDQLTSKSKFDREFGHFVRVLVDMDLKKEPLYRVLVERVGFAFFVDFEFENKPDFCHYCSCIGHNQGHCKRLHGDKSKQDLEQVTKQAPLQGTKKDYVIAKDNRKTTASVQTNPSSLDFDPMLECILRNKEVSNQVILDSITKPVHDVSNDPIDVDKVVDNEVEIVDDTSSDASEFVNNTPLDNFVDQEHPTAAAPHEPDALLLHSAQSEPVLSQGIATDLSTPDRIAHQMEFLKTSWDNLAEFEEENMDTNTADETNTPLNLDKVTAEADESFQLVTKKKKKNKSHNRTYRTRSKADSSSGFK